MDALCSTRSAAVFILRARRLSTIARAFLSAASRLSWAWMALSIWLTSRTLVAGTWLKTFRSGITFVLATANDVRKFIVANTAKNDQAQQTDRSLLEQKPDPAAGNRARGS